MLTNPLEVRQSLQQSFVEIFYQVHTGGKQRFRVVVVKVLKDGLFVSTAMTTAAMKSGRTIYRNGVGQ